MCSIKLSHNFFCDSRISVETWLLGDSSFVKTAHMTCFFGVRAKLKPLNRWKAVLSTCWIFLQYFNFHDLGKAKMYWKSRISPLPRKFRLKFITKVFQTSSKSNWLPFVCHFVTIVFRTRKSNIHVAWLRFVSSQKSWSMSEKLILYNINKSKGKKLEKRQLQKHVTKFVAVFWRVENIQEFVVEPDKAYEGKGVPSSLQCFFPLPFQSQ